MQFSQAAAAAGTVTVRVSVPRAPCSDACQRVGPLGGRAGPVVARAAFGTHRRRARPTRFLFRAPHDWSRALPNMNRARGRAAALESRRGGAVAENNDHPTRTGGGGTAQAKGPSIMVQDAPWRFAAMAGAPSPFASDM
jgi:hypothetical protein